ncbi:hypothetical protein [Glycomyces xiaoerkulensis]|uniref:hypothetical protein n=1 Tax=Glycomyces xiaoerkulensis TaxID=2038139 RepID=UPI000C25741F|nr:hypothetical protein [Glycomyces xiaoerkulensis]
MKRRIFGVLAAVAIGIGLAAAPAGPAAAEKEPGVYCPSDYWAATGYGPVMVCTEFAYYGYQQIQRPVTRSGITGETSPHGDWHHTGTDRCVSESLKGGNFRACGVYESDFGPLMYGTLHVWKNGCRHVQWGNLSLVTEKFHSDSDLMKTTSCK